jgi:hypothetical protein
VAITIVTIVCFILYCSSNFGLYINKAFALYKVLLLSMLIIAGTVIAVREKSPGRRDWDDERPGSPNIALAMVIVLFAYQGWENANYV